MVSNSVEAPQPTSLRPPVIVVALIASLALLFSAGWFVLRPVEIVVDGTALKVPIGTTVADLYTEDIFRAPAGDLLAVNGSVATTEGGAPPVVSLNGRPASSQVRLFVGDRLVSEPGADAREALVTTQVAISFQTVYRGKGPWLEIASLGAPGIRRVTTGAVSGVVSLAETVTPPHDEVVLRTRPRPGAKLVALTFDDGPVRGQTDRILDILKTEQVHATFFLLGKRVKAEPALGRRVVAEGHLVGNHSYNHADLRTQNDKVIAKQITSTSALISGMVGSGTPWFRPPYGSVDSRVLRVIKKSKQRIVMWDVDPQDWKKPGTKELVKRVVGQTQPGSVVLLHDGGGDRRQTVAALPAVIRELKKKGYVFVTVAELAVLSRESDKGASATSTPDGYDK